MPCLLLIVSQSDYLIQVVDTNAHIELQTVEIQISQLLKKLTDLDLHCLLGRAYPGSAEPGLNSTYLNNLIETNFLVPKKSSE